jgi:GT2 family glycosyltransferase
MKIAIAVLTWNRLPALQQILKGLGAHCSQHRQAVFEDAGIRDNTADSLLFCVQSVSEFKPEYRATHVKSMDVDVFLGSENLGVAGNSNRALRWFMQESECDYLCLCNDDLTVKGDFAAFYAEAWTKLKIGLFCYCGFTSKMYAWDPDHVSGYVIKKLGRMTGAMMAMPRELVDRIGYFDMRFGKFGEEHVDFTNRARLAGYQQVRNRSQPCLDLKHDLLEHLEVPSTMVGHEKAEAEAIASQGVKSIDYVADGLYRPYRLFNKIKVAGVDGDGISDKALGGYYDVVAKQEIMR